MFLQLKINWQIVFNGLLGIFTICGLCPIKIEGKRKLENFEVINIILVIWSLVQVAVITCLVGIACQTFFSDDSDVSSFNNILKFAIMAITHYAACIESIAARKNFVEIWIRIKTIDGMIGNMLQNYATTLKSLYKESARKISICLICTIVMELIIISNILAIKSWTFMWFITIIPLMMSRMRHFQHTLFIDLLTYRFRVIKQELKSIVKLTKMESNKLVVKNFVFYEALYKKISTIKSVYNTLWETSLYVNRSFGVSQLANLLQNFIQLTCDLYLVYSFLYNNNMTYILGKFLLFYQIQI